MTVMEKTLSIADVAPLPVTDISHVMREIGRHRRALEQIERMRRYERIKANIYRERKRNMA